MKLVKVCKSLGSISMDRAFDAVFGDEVLREVHGDSLQAGEWNGDRRKLKFKIDLISVPRELKRFVGGDSLRITTTQILKSRLDESICVENRVRMHFLGAELFQIKPQFSLVKDGNEVFVVGQVEHHAMLPPPLNSLAESFMSARSTSDLERYTECIRKLMDSSVNR